MKNTIIKSLSLILMLISSLNSFSQNTEWYDFELDSIGISFPTEQVYEIDTIIRGVRVKQLFTHIENSSLFIQKMPAENNSRSKNLSKLPHNHESLIDFYNGVVKGAKESSKGKYVTKEEVKSNNLTGYNYVIYNDNDQPIIESRAFLVESDLINLMIYNPVSELNNVKSTFYNSLNFDRLSSLNQYPGTSKVFRQGYAMGKLFVYLVFAVIIFFAVRAAIKKK